MFTIGYNLPKEDKANSELPRKNSFLAITALKEQAIVNEFIPNNGKGGLVDDEIINVDEMQYPLWDIVEPMSSLRVTQRYHTYHRALDFGWTYDGGIYAVATGTITYAGWLDGYGYHIEILHENDYTTTYSHLSRYDVEVHNPAVTGQLIGKVGSTGFSTGAHLHFEIKNSDGVKIDPSEYLLNEK